MIRVAVVDDHPLFRGGVIQTLQSAGDVMVVGQGATVADAIRLSYEFCPDVMILDMNLVERRDGLRAAEAIVSGAPKVRILADSTGWWAWIPRHRGQRFHGMMGTDSTGSWAPG